MKRTLTIIALAITFVGTPAQAKDRTKREARKVFNEGVDAFNEGLLADALESFKKAYGLRPSFRILYNIGQTEAELKHFDSALEAFEGYLAQGGDRIGEDRRLSVEKEVERLHRLIGRVIIRGTRGGEVWVDGERRGFLPMAGSISLNAGKHELIVRRGTLRPCQKTITVKGGQESEEICLLLDENEAARNGFDDGSTNLSSSAEFRVNTRNGQFLDKTAPWLTAGLGVVTLTTGVILGLKTSSLNKSLSSTCPDGDCPPEQHADMEKLPRLAAAADGMFIATVVLGGLSTLLFTQPWKKKKKQTDDH